MNNYELVKFKDDNIELDVRIAPDEDTVWLTLEELSILFARDKSVISRHINNIFNDKELERSTSVAKNAIEINNQIHYIYYYNLDVILSVGYRVKSRQGITFRIWANNVLKRYLLRGYVTNKNRTLITNENYINLINEVNSMKKEIHDINEKINKFYPKELLFYKGEMFESIIFINNLLQKANKKVIIIDGYADDNIFNYLLCINKKVNVSVVTRKPGRISNKNLSLYESTDREINIIKNDNFHDRYIIVDDDIYLLGGSLNGIGNNISTLIKIEDFKIKEIIENEIFNIS